MQNDMLVAALSYASRGLRVFPLRTREKLPAIAWKEGSTTDADQIRRWFRAGPYNIGVVVPAGIMVVDLDLKNDVDGFASLAELESIHGTLPASPVQCSPSGSEHRWFKLPHGTFVGNSAGTIADGIDVRSSRPDGDDVKVGMVVAAPSRTEKGVYTWIKELPQDLDDLPMAPAWLIAAANFKKTKMAASKSTKCSALEVIGGNIPEGARNTALTSVAGSMHRMGMGVDAITAALIVENETRCDPPLDRGDVETIARSVCGYPIGADVALAVAPADWRDRLAEAEGDADTIVELARGINTDTGLSATNRASLIKACAKAAGVAVKNLQQDIGPALTRGRSEVIAVIDVSRSDFASSVDQAVALLPTMAGLRQRCGELVELVPVPERNTVSIQTVTPPRLAYLLARAARWSYYNGDGGPDPAVVSAIMSQGYWPGVPPLAGLLYQPCLAQDGGLISTPGYDPATMREAVFNGDAFPICDLTGDEALAELRGLLTGYPFATDVDESAALAAILTAATRPGLTTAPAFLVTAGDLGSGKSHLAKLAGLFAGGAKVRGWPKSNIDEQNKAITSALLQMAPSVLFDNMTKPWTSESMAIVLTESSYSDRLLGVQRNVEMSTACLWLATGCNVHPGADLMRRVVTIELDARVERPWERKFLFDPVIKVERDRGAWVMVALKFLQEGRRRPSPWLPPLGGFGDWTATVRHALVAYGLPDPVAALTRNAGDDDDRDMLGSLLVLWDECFSGELLTVRDLLADTQGALGGSARASLRCLLLEIAGEKGEVNAKRLGNWLACNEKVVVDRLRLVKGARTNRGRTWSVQRWLCR